MGKQGRADDGAGRAGDVYLLHGGDFVEGDVDFDVPDPEAKPTVRGDVHAAYRVVPEPLHQGKVHYGH